MLRTHKSWCIAGLFQCNILMANKSMNSYLNYRSFYSSCISFSYNVIVHMNKSRDQGRCLVIFQMKCKDFMDNSFMNSCPFLMNY